MSADRGGKHPSLHRYPPEMRDRAVRMVTEAIEAGGGVRFGVVTRIARELGIGSETLRVWVRQAEVDRGSRPGITSEDKRRIAELERELREVRRANEILKAAAGFFARELDPRLPRS
jgi:transposase